MRVNKFMKMAIEEAEKGREFVHPNPMVGAIIVKNGHVIGKGYHKAFGMEHAEVMALRQAGEKAKDADMYITLEPCIHHGKTPPCAPLIVKKDIKNVYVGIQDPNPLVNGKGIAYLKEHGINVETGIYKNKISELNRAYIKFHKKHLPFVTVKIATTLDGKIALFNGDAKWITDEEMREWTHKLRNRFDGILTGSGTILKDDPFLDTTPPRERWHKFILDTYRKVPFDAHIFLNGKVVLFTALHQYDVDKNPKGEVIQISMDEEHLSLKEVMKNIIKKGVLELLVEAGPSLLTSLIKAKLVDEILHCINFSYLGNGMGFFNYTPTKLKDRIYLKNTQILKLGKGIIIRGKPSSQE